MTWEWTIARPMLLVHALTGFGALAIAVHVLYFSWRGGRERASGHRSKAARYAGITWPMYIAAMLSGAITYPAYVVGVRKQYLDANQPAMTGLFEIKEHWAAIGLILIWGLWRHFRRATPVELGSSDLRFWRGQTALALLLVVCLAVNVLVGLWVTFVKSV